MSSAFQSRSALKKDSKVRSKRSGFFSLFAVPVSTVPRILRSSYIWFQISQRAIHPTAGMAEVMAKEFQIPIVIATYESATRTSVTLQRCLA